MAKPNPICELNHGDIITRQNYPTFVETFNTTAQRCSNLRGDGDLDPQQGKVTVDNTDYEHPVVRLTQTFLSSIGGGGDARVQVDSEISSEYETEGISSLTYVKDDPVLSATYYELFNFKNWEYDSGTVISAAARSVYDPVENWEVLVRDRGEYGQGPFTLRYRKLGRIVSGTNSNVQVSKDGAGNMVINVYYV